MNDRANDRVIYLWPENAATIAWIDAALSRPGAESCGSQVAPFPTSGVPKRPEFTSLDLLNLHLLWLSQK